MSRRTATCRWSVASRVAAAALGGYAFTSAAMVLLALLWPAPLAQGVAWASLLGFALYTMAVIWAFTTPTATRAWAGMAGATTLCATCAALAWWLRQGSLP